MRAGFKRMLNIDGQPVRTDSEHASQYGDRMPPRLADEVTLEYLVMPEVFRTELCKGFDPKVVCQVLIDHGCLALPDAKADLGQGRVMSRVRIPGVGGQISVYRLTPKLLELDL